METINKKQVAEEYKEFYELATELTKKEYPNINLYNASQSEDAYEHHMLNMLSMYFTRYGNPEERLLIVDYIQRQLNELNPNNLKYKEVGAWQITKEHWENIRKAIISGNYRDISKETT